MRTSDVVVIGAGVLGTAIALAMARSGRRVTVVDRARAPGHGSTSASAGIVRVHAADAQSCALAAEAVEVWDEWADFVDARTGEATAPFQRCGSVILDDGGSYIGTASEAMSDASVNFERWSFDDLAAQLPYADLRRFGPPKAVPDDAFWAEPDAPLGGGLYTPDSGYVGDPALAAQNMLDAATRLGVSTVLGHAVVRVVRAGDRVRGVVLDDGAELIAPVVINAAGPHSSRVNALAGVGGDFRVGVRQIREELHELPAPTGVDFEADGLHIVDGDLGINFRPATGNTILVGGSGAAVDPEVRIDDLDSLDPRVTKPAWERNALRLARRITDLRVPHRPAGVAGLYDTTDDWLPIYDKTDLDGFFVAMGTSGNQFKTAPIVGDLVRQLIDADANGSDLDNESIPLKGLATGRTFWSAPFSRLRTPITGGVRG